MIEHLGTLFGLGKMLKDFLAWKEESKLVDNYWLKKSGFQQRCENEGYHLRWSNPEKMETRKLKGWEILYEVDKKLRVRRFLKNNSGDVLLCKIQR